MLASLCRYIAKRIRDYANYAILRRKVRVEQTSKVIELFQIFSIFTIDTLLLRSMENRKNTVTIII